MTASTNGPCLISSKAERSGHVTRVPSTSTTSSLDRRARTVVTPGRRMRQRSAVRTTEMSSARSPSLVQAVPSRIGHPEQVGGSPAGDRGIRRKRNSDRMRAERRIRCFRVTAPEPDAAGGNMPQRSAQLARTPASRASRRRIGRRTRSSGTGGSTPGSVAHRGGCALSPIHRSRRLVQSRTTHGRVEGEGTKRSRVATSPRCGRRGAGRGSAQPRPGSARGSPA